MHLGFFTLLQRGEMAKNILVYLSAASRYLGRRRHSGFRPATPLYSHRTPHAYQQVSRGILRLLPQYAIIAVHTRYL